MTTKQIGFWVSIVMAVLAVAAQGSIHLPVGVPESWGAIIQSWSAFIMAIYLIINPFLPSDVVGPLKPPAPVALKAVLLAVLFIGAFGAFDRAHAKMRTCTPGFLGCPPVHGTPRPAVIPSPSGSSTQDIFSGLLQFQSQIVADLQQADTTQAAVINPATGQAWDPFSHACLAGIPASGTPGQPGYVAASPGLIAWVQGLQPLGVSSVPPLPASPSAATVAVHARLLVIAAEGDVNTLVGQINTGGFPQSLRLACGAVINDTVNQVNTIGAQVAGFDALLAKFVLPVMAAHKGPVK